MIAKALGYYLRHIPRHPGRWRIEAAAMKRAGELRGRLGPTTLQTAHGFRLIVDGNSQTGRVLYLTGHYEPEITALIERLIAPGDLVVDGGAHIGFFTLLSSGRVGATGRVIAFEPSGPTAEVLEKNVRLNGRTNVTIVQAGLSDKTGTGVLAQASASETGQATLRPISDAVSSRAVDLAALDDVLAGKQQRVALVKLDVEGAELRALQGMKRVLARDRPHVIVEVTDTFLRQAGSAAVDLYRFLTGFGYAAHVIDWQGSQQLTSEEAFIQCGEQFNALFTMLAGL
jgi:FkbM family methyltransferase